MAEKIASAYHLVVAENSNEEAEMNKCKSAVKRIRKMEKDVEEACSTGNNHSVFTNHWDYEHYMPRFFVSESYMYICLSSKRQPEKKIIGQRVGRGRIPFETMY